MKYLTETYKLNNGQEIPKIGLGTWQVKNGDEAYNSVLKALKVGYKHIDSAQGYQNEESVGKAIKDVDIDDDAFKYIEAIIGSMTPNERSNPELLNLNRKKRIATGAGRDLKEVNQMVKQFHQMSKMMKMMQGGKGKQMMQMFQGLR